MGLVVITGTILAMVAYADTSIAPTILEGKADITCIDSDSCEYAKLASDYPDYHKLLNEMSVRNPTLGCVVNAESQCNNYNDDGTIKRGKAGEFGIAQFMAPTFYGWSKQMKFETADVTSPTDELIIMYWAFKNHLENNWTTLKDCMPHLLRPPC